MPKSLLLLIPLLFFSINLCAQSYEEANQLFKEGKLDEAFEILLQIPDGEETEARKEYRKAKVLMKRITDIQAAEFQKALKEQEAERKRLEFLTPAFRKYPEGIQHIFVNGVDITQIDELKYIQIVGYRRFFSEKTAIFVDYGQFSPMLQVFTNKPRGSIIKDHQGNEIEFMGMIDALNFFENNGWSFINETKYTQNKDLISHFLLRKNF